MTFRLKTILGIGLIEGALLILMVVSAQGFLRESNEEQFIQRATSTASLFSDATKNAVIATDLALLDSFVREISTNTEVVYVRVVGQDDIVLSEAGPADALQREFSADTNFEDLSDSVFDVSAPIIESGYPYGRVEIGFSHSKIEQLLENSQRTLSGIALVEIILVALFSYLLGTYLTRQLHYLKKGSEKLAAGKLGYQIPVRGSDEIAQTVNSFNRMSRKLKESELRKDAYMHSALHAIITLSDTGEISDVNGASEVLFFEARENMIGRHISEILVLEQEQVNKQLCALGGDGDCDELLSKIHESSMTNSSGNVIYLQWVVSEIRLDNENIFVIFAENINERKEAELSMIESTRAAQEANAAKSEFLANMTHELRTPLQGIIGFSSLGVKRADKISKEKVHKYFTTIQNSADTLLNLVNNLLDLTRLESGKMDYEFAGLDMNEAITSVIGEFGSQVNDRGLNIDHVQSDVPVECVFDNAKIQQVVRNMLSNAIKFSPDGGDITITVKSDADAVTVQMADCGPGIPEQELETVFDKFAQSSVTQDGSGGTGLGLPICREIVTTHGGTITAARGEDKGAVFTFTVPHGIEVSKRGEKSVTPDSQEISKAA